MEPGWIEIDLQAITHNLKEIKRIIGKEIKTMPVVKADAYGHGLVPVSQTLVQAGADFLAVSYVEEGIKLRSAGLNVPIVVLLGVLKSEIEAIFSYKLTPVVYRLEVAQALSKAAQRYKEILPVFVKIDTGMGRLGVFYKEAANFLKALSLLPGLKIEGVTSHLALAETDKEFTQIQIQRFKTVLKSAQTLGLELKFNHIANSAASLEYKDSYFQAVRPGLSVYGIYPLPSLKKEVALQPVMSFKTRVIYLKWLPARAGVSYGHTFITPRPTKVAVIPIGYDQGLFRQLSNKGEVLIKGKRAPIIGTICMHLTMIDVTSIDGIDIGEEVVILGRQGEEEITADEIAQKAGTISYDVLCRFGRSNPRVYLRDT
ncbi:MAG: alanine racemase [Candidatus Desulfofervidaceae bacterium]|nr:alanine racemase [Candidatus Desulfofervidaceae bacterium]MDL1970961.1 alanine racemase [Candidatus Desulfofervidaceae bacterium]